MEDRPSVAVDSAQAMDTKEAATRLLQLRPYTAQELLAELKGMFGDLQGKEECERVLRNIAGSDSLQQIAKNGVMYFSLSV
ncbi:hypothetical protein AAVH_20312 [Aphelenchoides avenae]|nr:hypothetical protein AAVH_20312 [Aphelenchus avenae]